MTDLHVKTTAALQEACRARQEHMRLPQCPPCVEAARHLAEIAGSRGPSGVASVLHQALGDAAARCDEVQVVATGSAWVGGGTGSVGSAVEELILSATCEILLTAFSVTRGAERIVRALETAIQTGVQCVLVVDRPENQDGEQLARVLALRNRFPASFRVFGFNSSDDTEGLHAKLLVVDRRTAFVGSSNLSFRGMVSAHEVGVIVRGPTADRLASLVDRLLAVPYVRPLP